MAIDTDTRRALDFPIMENKEVPKWENIASCFVETAEQVVGRGISKRMGTPFSEQQAMKIDEIRQDLRTASDEVRRVRYTAEEGHARFQ